MKYTLHVSHDAGTHYRPEASADNEWELTAKCQESNSRKLRWYVEDNDTKEIRQISDIHLQTIASVRLSGATLLSNDHVLARLLRMG